MEPLPIKEFRRLDLNSEELGVPVSKLMANAGRALAEAARAMGDSVLLLCGKGNNGGDGFAAAGVLHRWGVPATVVLVEPKNKIRGVARQYLDLLPAEAVQAWGPRRPWQADVVVDCLLGSGLHGKPRKPYDQAIRWINKHPRVLACDVPSGMGSGLQVQATRTVTFHAMKENMEGAGEVTVADIGIPARADFVGFGDLDAAWIRKEHPHKGDHGRVLVIGGGPYSGAPHYAGMGAVRAGADLVHVATTDAVAATIATWGPDLLVHGVSPAAMMDELAIPAILELASHADALVIGPGLGEAPIVEAILDATKQPCVLDADGLRLGPSVLQRHGRRLVLTPHAAEFKRMTGRAGNARNAAALSRETGAVVLLKGEVDLIAHGDRIRRCERGHPCMTSGGTGDVLAGIVGALLARGADRLDAAAGAAYLIGRAGELAGALKGQGATATDVHEAIPAILVA